jgi:hypothetical protein
VGEPIEACVDRPIDPGDDSELAGLHAQIVGQVQSLVDRARAHTRVGKGVLP